MEYCHFTDCVYFPNPSAVYKMHAKTKEKNEGES